MILFKWMFTLCLLAGWFSFSSSGAEGRMTHDTISRPPTLDHPIRLLLSNMRSNNYLNAYLTLKSQEQAYHASPFKASYLETMALVSYYIGEFDAAVAYDSAFRSNGRKPAAAHPVPADPMVLRPIHETLRTVARQEQVIMINEEHRYPQHRALTAALLEVLYQAGFRYLALETLTASDTLLQARGYVTQRSGFYTADPVFATMIREAIAIGYTLVPYEWEAPCEGTDCDNEREKGQARQLYERILQKDPQAKILVHAGRAHIAEVRENGSTAFMAWHFRDITGIDPFTIDQLFFSDNSGKEFQRPLYQDLMAKHDIRTPVIIANADGSFYKAGSYDMHILHPPHTYVQMRPTWLAQGRTFHTVDVRRLGLDKVPPGNALIQALTHPEDSLQVPLDQVLFKNGRPQLLLPKGRLNIRAVDRNRVVLGSYWLEN